MYYNLFIQLNFQFIYPTIFLIYYVILISQHILQFNYSTIFLNYFCNYIFNINLERRLSTLRHERIACSSCANPTLKNRITYRGNRVTGTFAWSRCGNIRVLLISKQQHRLLRISSAVDTEWMPSNCAWTSPLVPHTEPPSQQAETSLHLCCRSNFTKVIIIWNAFLHNSFTPREDA